MTAILLSLWHKLSPHHRRIAAKRQLQEILVSHGISKRRATLITNRFFYKP
jgi:hypothetical protein